jgi:hypothetical protein
MLNLALVSDHASPLADLGSVDCGGQNVYVAHLASQLARLGCRVDVFTRRERPEQPLLVQWQERVRVIHVPAGPAQAVRKEDMLPYMSTFAAWMAEFARQQSQRYDLVHANFFMSGMVARKLRRTLGVPFVITFHALGLVRRQMQGSADTFPEQRIAVERALMREADRIVAECPQDCDDMQSLYGAPPARIDIVPCGFDPHELGPMQGRARRKLGLPNHEFIVLQLGRMVPRKGIDNVIEAMAVLRDSHRIDGRLLVVGGSGQAEGADDSPELARLKRIVAALSLEDRVVFTGPKARSQLSTYYSAANVFVSTPWYEPFGITPLEAMACATPVIGSAVGGIRTTVVDGVSGYLVPPRDPVALAERLVRLHADPKLARRMGDEGLRRVHRFYTWRSVAERMLAVYARALGPQLGRRAGGWEG